MRPSAPRVTESRSSAKGGRAHYRSRCSRGSTIDTPLETKERDPDTRVDGKPAVLPGEYVGGGSSVEQAREPEPADHAAADSLGERGQIGRGDRPRWDERRRSVTRRCGSSRHEDAIGHAYVQVHVVVEPGAEAAEEGDGAESWATYACTLCRARGRIRSRAVRT